MSVYFKCILDNPGLSDGFERTILNILNDLLAKTGFAGGEVGVILADDSYLQSLNERYRGICAPTDVLSFSMLEGEEPGFCEEEGFPVGDIYISMDRAAAQAVEAGHSVQREVAVLTVHGMLHLLGFDHAGEDDARRMRDKEHALMKVYDRGAGGCSGGG